MYVSGNNYSQAYHQKNTINSKNNYRDRINICPVKSNTTQKRASKNATEKCLSNLAEMNIALSHNIKSAMLVDPIKQRYRPCSYPENKIYYQHGYNLSLKKNGFQLLDAG
ncbi:hypothetical protein C0J52_25692 [Blattella germanica]|nr:hypothetical protein C0J52_25692 [Blattella germanica]